MTKYNPQATYTVAARKSIKVLINDQHQLLTEGQRVVGEALGKEQISAFLKSGYLVPESQFDPRETIQPRNLNEKPGAKAKGDEMPERDPVIQPTRHQGKWNHDPASLADKEREQLLVLILETEPEFENVNDLSYEQAVEVLTADFDPEFVQPKDEVREDDNSEGIASQVAGSAVSERK